MHFLLRNEIPRQLVTRSCRQFSQELSLCPPVALAKWMDGVHLFQRSKQLARRTLVSRLLAGGVRSPADRELSGVPEQCTPVGRRTNCPSPCSQCGILRPRRTHPEIDGGISTSDDLSQSGQQRGFRKARGAVQNSGRFQSVPGSPHHECQEDSGESRYQDKRRDHSRR
jgi:hypothetical protein